MSSYQIFADQLPSAPIRPVTDAHIPQLPATLAAGNGTTNFGTVAEGTILGRVTSGGLVRPCGKALVTAAATSATVEVDSNASFYAGDPVRVRSVAGRVGTRQITASSGGATVTVTGRIADGKAHTVALVDPSANDSPLAVSVSYNEAGVASIVVSLATGGGGAITSTVAQITAALNGSAASAPLVFAVAGGTTSQTAIAVSALALQNGLAPGAVVATGLTVSSKNSTDELVLSASVTVAIGDVVELTNGAQTAIGVLERKVSTYDVTASTATGAVVHKAQQVSYTAQGLYLAAALVGLNSETIADLGATRLGGATGTIVRL